MDRSPIHTYCWEPIWDPQRQGTGMEHLLVGDLFADSVLLAFDGDDSPYRLIYRLDWDASWRIHRAELHVVTGAGLRELTLRTDGQGHWKHANGAPIDDLDGCLDIDIWPTPFTNTFPIQRQPMVDGARREFDIAWISAPELTIHRRIQAYSRKDEHTYTFDSLDEDNVKVDLRVDADLIVIDYPGMFRRLNRPAHSD